MNHRPIIRTEHWTAVPVARSTWHVYGIERTELGHHVLIGEVDDFLDRDSGPFDFCTGHSRAWSAIGYQYDTVATASTLSGAIDAGIAKLTAAGRLRADYGGDSYR